MRILITGSSGQLGSEFAELFRNENLKAFPHSELDVTDFERVQKIIEEFRPDILINTSAYHLVDECEDYPEKAFLVNAIAVRNLAILSRRYNFTLVHFSTDYVFDGEKNSPYHEDDPPSPLSVYGLSKYCGEIFIKNNTEKYYIIRTCGLYGAKGKAGKGGNFIERILKKWKEGRELKIVCDQIVTPTYAKELAEKVKILLLKGSPFGLYHMTNEGECSWFEFSKKVFEFAGIEADIQPASSEELNLKAKRPKYSVLDNRNMRVAGIPDFRHWTSALKEYMEERVYER